MSDNCPNCGSELVSKLEIKDAEDNVLEVIEPEGGILVCSGCHNAVDPNAPDAEASEPLNEDGVEPTPAPELGPPAGPLLGADDISDDPEF